MAPKQTARPEIRTGGHVTLPRFAELRSAQLGADVAERRRSEGCSCSRARNRKCAPTVAEPAARTVSLPDVRGI